MQIQWKGHASFLITDQHGTRILTDPFDDRVGYPLPNEVVNIVTVSHQHADHNSTQLLSGKPQVVTGPGRHEAAGINITGVDTWHDDVQGAKRGSNTVFVLNVDGIKVCHLGDLGHLLSEKQVVTIGAVDVLCVPVGGFYTIDATAAQTVVKQLKPSIVLPMHYKYNAGIKLPIAPIEDFLRLYPHVEERDSLALTRESLPASQQVIVLKLT